MHTILFAIVTLWIITEGDLGGIPSGKCRYPIPSFPGMNITEVEGQIFKYVYTPDVKMFNYIDSIAMLIKHMGNNMYSEIFRAHTIFGTTTKLRFNLEYLGDGILKMKSKDGGDATYIASIVAIDEISEVGLLYLCSDTGKNKEDMRYVIARKDVDPDKVAHPDILFKDINEKYQFKGMFRKLPLKRLKLKH